MGDDAQRTAAQQRGLNEEVAARVARLDLSFNEHGFDRFGVSKGTIAAGMPVMGWLYRHYFRVRCHGIEHIPPRGRVILVGNHSGGYAIDAGMVIAACFFELEPPRLAHGMADRFINRLPFLSQLANRSGQITGLPQHARQLLADDRVLLVFPEGARGTSKLFWNRYTLGPFGTGFVRLARSTGSPVVPFAYLGGGEAVPTIANLPFLGKLFGVPYIPVTPYVLPLPLPVSSELRFGAPLRFYGTGDESQQVIQRDVDEVKDVIAGLIAEGRESRARGQRALPRGR
ncbi:MAG TPA: lysophospholipid acyltransferase family protein [Polyangiaceae bacterium]|nr:lysophospholipid acyltransferase family protein [Polyangiaceae bacterium]